MELALLCLNCLEVVLSGVTAVIACRDYCLSAEVRPPRDWDKRKQKAQAGDVQAGGTWGLCLSLVAKHSIARPQRQPTVQWGREGTGQRMAAEVANAGSPKGNSHELSAPLATALLAPKAGSPHPGGLWRAGFGPG